MKISFNRAIVEGPYGGGNQILMLLVDYFKRRGIETCFDLADDVDAIFAVDVRDEVCCYGINDIISFKGKHAKVRLLHRINTNGSHIKNDGKRDERIIDFNKRCADITVFISSWVKKYFRNLGLISKGVVIENAADRSIFLPSNDVRNQNDPLKIITHHWSDNMAKGYAVYDYVSNFCYNNPQIAEFYFMGRHPRKMCDKAKCISAQSYANIPKYLKDKDLYVTATTFEAGGCHLVEGMACGLVPFVLEGSGGPEEYMKDFGFLFRDSKELLEKIVMLKDNYDLFLRYKHKISDEYTYSSNDMGRMYYDIIMEKLC